MSWFQKLLPRVKTVAKKGIPEGVWHKCTSCEATLYREELKKNSMVCPQCDHHMRIDAKTRLTMFLDEGSWHTFADDVDAKDRLKFKDTKRYKDRLTQAIKQTGSQEALLVAQGELEGQKVVVASFNFFFIGGSMSSAVGERFVQGVQTAIAGRMPLVCFAISGGARMQEGLFSLFQMAKTSAALARMDDHKLPFICVLLDPTMGGVSASLATLGDIVVAEPGALIGFSGPRVIEQTIGEKLPEGFQRSEFLLEHGAIDKIVHRHQLRATLSRILHHLQPLDESHG